MDAKIKNYCKWGIAVAIGWNVLILSIYSVMCWIKGVAFSENIEVDTWVGFWICYAVASLVWFYVGYGLRKEYLTTRADFAASAPESSASEIDTLCKRHFLRYYGKILLMNVLLAIPAHILFREKGELSLREMIVLCVLMFATLIIFFRLNRTTK